VIKQSFFVHAGNKNPACGAPWLSDNTRQNPGTKMDFSDQEMETLSEKKRFLDQMRETWRKYGILALTVGMAFRYYKIN
jgi:hypothetical protein